jgi:hypothetical protein
MKTRAGAKRAKPSSKPVETNGEQRQAPPWRTLISAVHPNPTVRINNGATSCASMGAGLNR